MNERFRRLSVGICFLLVAGVLVAVHNRQNLSHQEFVGISHPAQGHVISVERHDSEDGPLYDLIVEYVTGDGVTRHFTDRGLMQSYQTGESVTVLYDPQNPDHVEISSPEPQLMYPFLQISAFTFAFVGGLLILASFIRVHRVQAQP
jgi:hypothetical protein